MGSIMRGLRSAAPLSIALLAVLVLQAGCGGNGGRLSDALITADGPDLAWPPQGLPTRSASDDTIFVDGKDSSSKGGSTQVQLSSLVLRNGSSLSWAIYAVNGFGPTVSLADLTAEFDLVTGQAGDGTTLYIGLSNYSTARWDWTAADFPSESFDLSANFSDYLSPDGTFYVACVHVGPGNISIHRLIYSRTGSGAFVPAPQNLLPAPDFGEMGLSWDAVPFVQGYDIYRDTDAAFDNPVKLNLSLNLQPNFIDSTVAPETDYWYAVKALRGETGNYLESAFSEVAATTSLGDTLATPQNLTGTADVGTAHLAWDPVPGAQSYILYRSISVTFSNPTQIMAIITDPLYDDAGLAWDKMYYYKVVAKSGTHLSDYSDMADIFVPGTDLPAPTNLHVITSRGDYVSLGWDYSGPSPAGFYVYLSGTKDFALDGGYYKSKPIANPAARDCAFFDLSPNTTLYARVVAYNASNQRGRASDDISFTTEKYWTWETPQQIGTGTGPLALLDGDGGSVNPTLAYLNGTAVKVRQYSAFTWTAEEAVGLESGTADGGFGINIDMAYSGSDYLIGAYAPQPDDAWVSIGNPGGSWTSERIHGDNSTALGHDESGMSLRVAADANEYSVSHVHHYSETPSLYGIHLQQHPHGAGAWSGVQIHDDVMEFMGSSIAYDAGNLYMMFSNSITHTFLYGDQDGAWNWQDINDVAPQNLGLFNDIHKYGSEWITPAYNGTTKELCAMQGSGNTWTKTVLVDGLDNLNRMQIAVLDDGDPSPAAAMIIFYSSANSRWFYAYFNGTDWEAASLLIPGLTLGTNMDICKVVFSGTAYPFLVFDDDSGMLWSALGTPPV